MRVTLDHREMVTKNIISLYFRKSMPINYLAGQFSEIRLPHGDMDIRGDRRWFTLSSSPEDEFIRLTTRYGHDSSPSSFKRALFDLVPGDSIDISEPMGDFVLPKQVKTPLIFIAGGIGITPFLSMLGYLVAKSEVRPIQLFYFVHQIQDIVPLPMGIHSWLKQVIIVAKPSKAWVGGIGRPNTNWLLDKARITNDSLIYISGPKLMVENLAAGFMDTNISPNQIITDSFLGYNKI